MDKIIVFIILAISFLTEGTVTGNVQKSEERKELTAASETKIPDEIFMRELNAIKKDMEILSAENQLLKVEVQHLKEVVYRGVQRENNFLKTEVAHLRTENKGFSMQLNEYKSDIEELKAAQNTFVSFTAFPTVTRDYDADQRIVFDGIVRNYGGHYSNFSSIFTCPTKGYYLFSVTTRTTTIPLTASLRLDGVAMVSLTSDGNYNSATNLVITLCEEGQAVDVVCTSDGHQLNGNTRSTFSGVLLQLVVE